MKFISSPRGHAISLLDPALMEGCFFPLHSFSPFNCAAVQAGREVVQIRPQLEEAR